MTSDKCEPLLAAVAEKKEYYLQRCGVCFVLPLPTCCAALCLRTPGSYLLLRHPAKRVADG